MHSNSDRVFKLRRVFAIHHLVNCGLHIQVYPHFEQKKELLALVIHWFGAYWYKIYIHLSVSAASWLVRYSSPFISAINCFVYKHHEETFQKLELYLCFYCSKVCCDWRDIALTIRDRVFEEGEEQLIDMHDVKVTDFLTFWLSFTLLKFYFCSTSLLHVVLLTEFHTLEISFWKIHVCSLHKNQNTPLKSSKW